VGCGEEKRKRSLAKIAKIAKIAKKNSEALKLGISEF
jgi:hypothetical protein